MTKHRLTVNELAQWAEVDASFVERAAKSGALGAETGNGFSPEDATKCRFLAAWDSAGLPVETVGGLVASGEIQFSFLGAPFLAVEPRLALTYAELSRKTGVDLGMVQLLHEAMGFQPPDPEDRAREDDQRLLEWARIMSSAGFSEAAILRLARVYSAELRRITIAEAEGYESEIEDPHREQGASELELFELGGQIGKRLPELFERSIVDIYRRHRRLIWLDHSIRHIEIILESKGLFERMDRPPCVCFVDLTGFTRLTEEQGDQVAAQVARRLEELVERMSHRFSGRPVRWLGDGGMFVFQDPLAAVDASVAMVEAVSESGLPPTHIGIHCGPVIFQDGDIYGRTVNLASRLASVATAGEILVSAPMVERIGQARRFELVGPLELKGVAEPLVTYRLAPNTRTQGS